VVNKTETENKIFIAYGGLVNQRVKLKLADWQHGRVC
jgi:hypothetical protein